MSRLIKALSVQIQSPRVVESDLETAVSLAEEQDDTPTVQDGPEDITNLQEQANVILAETEGMVRELLDTARQEADKIIKSAHEEARRIVADGREQNRQAEEEAVGKGRRTGLEAGKAQAEEEYRSKLQEADELLQAAHQERRQILAGVESEIVELAVTVARKIIDAEIQISPDLITNMVKRAVQKAADREELTVRVNPEDLDSTINAQEEILKSAKGIRKLKIVADSAITAGGCVVEGQNGTVDARIEGQISEIEQALTEVRSENGIK